MSMVRRLEDVRLLVVEDEPDSLEAIRRLLELHGASVVAVTSVEDALAMLPGYQPHVVVSDLALPGEDGFSLVRRMRVLPPQEGGRTPAVALTAHTGPEYRQRAFEIGFQRFLAKPVDAAVLVETLVELVKGPRPGPPRQAVTAYAHVEKVPDLSQVHVLVVDDERDARDLMERVLTRCGAQVATASSAAEALASFAQRPPDILVADVGMPGENGYTLMRKVRALPPERGGSVPAVCLTAYTSTEDRIQALQAGFQIHMPKPVNFPELAATISSLVDRRPAG
jgi:CheY-like chemotaxis protein